VRAVKIPNFIFHNYHMYINCAVTELKKIARTPLVFRNIELIILALDQLFTHSAGSTTEWFRTQERLETAAKGRVQTDGG
jgi:hypothetical protein